jgi:hypothetical protein
VAVIFSDNFNRANSDSLGANWTENAALGTDVDIVGNVARAMSHGGSGAVIETTTNAHAAIADCRVTVRLVSTSCYAGPIVRWNQSTFDGYMAVLNVTGTITVYRIIGGTPTSLGTRSVTRVTGETVGLEVSGTGATVTLKVFHNGAQQGADISDTDAARITAAGRTGVDIVAIANGEVDDFEVDDLSVSGSVIPVILHHLRQQGIA